MQMVQGCRAWQEFVHTSIGHGNPKGYGIPWALLWRFGSECQLWTRYYIGSWTFINYFCNNLLIFKAKFSTSLRQWVLLENNLFLFKGYPLIKLFVLLRLGSTSRRQQQPSDWIRGRKQMGFFFWKILNSSHFNIAWYYRILAYSQ